MSFKHADQQREDELGTLQGVDQPESKDEKSKDPESKKPESKEEKKDGDATEPIKYSISSDPRSTAYSTKPLGPNPKSVDIRIVRPNQVAAGTLIGYNATKNESKTYYGGDLVFSPSVVTLSRSNPVHSQNITVSTPSGAIADGMPGSPWYVSGEAAWPAFDSNAYTGPGTSWILFLELSYPYRAPGTYKVHITTAHDKTSNNTVIQYDGFITVKIVP